MIEAKERQIILRQSMRSNAVASLSHIKLLLSQAKAVIGMDELRNDEELLFLSEHIIMKLTKAKVLLEMMIEDL
jgi:hypothetical protein